MTTPLQKLGGLSEGEIRALVLANNEDLDQRWDERMEKQGDRFDKRMDKHESEVKQRFEVTEGKIDATLSKVNELGELMRESNRIQHGWHDGDLEYRASIQGWRDKQEPFIEGIDKKVDTFGASVEKAIEDIKEVRHRMKLISIFFTLGRGFAGMRVVAKESKETLTAVAAVCSALTLIWLFFHSFIPWLEKAWRH